MIGADAHRRAALGVSGDDHCRRAADRAGKGLDFSLAAIAGRQRDWADRS
jgi:hypothetical protein